MGKEIDPEAASQAGSRKGKKPVQLRLVRGGEERNMTVTVKERPQGDHGRGGRSRHGRGHGHG